jgi:hypothetical protein
MTIADTRPAGTRREALEHERAEFQARLHRRSDDFAATEGLRAVELALRLAPRDGDDRVRRAQR